MADGEGVSDLLIFKNRLAPHQPNAPEQKPHPVQAVPVPQPAQQAPKPAPKPAQKPAPAPWNPKYAISHEQEQEEEALMAPEEHQPQQAPAPRRPVQAAVQTPPAPPPPSPAQQMQPQQAPIYQARTPTPPPPQTEQQQGLFKYFANKGKKGLYTPAKYIMKTGESIKLAKGQFCVNHPWRHAYAVCNVCRLPYCYIDIMEDHGKLYCLNDIDQSATSSDTDLNPSVNSFTAISSVIFLANSALLGYYVYPQALYLATNAVNSGTISYLLTIGQSYYLPLANMAIAVFGVIAAFSIFRKSIYGFALGLLVSMVGLMLVLYEYLNSSVPYLFVSSALLLLSLASMTYSKMSAAKEVIEQNSTVSEIEWPKTETY